jgi:hypothetical protein
MTESAYVTATVQVGLEDESESILLLFYRVTPFAEISDLSSHMCIFKSRKLIPRLMLLLPFYLSQADCSTEFSTNEQWRDCYPFKVRSPSRLLRMIFTVNQGSDTLEVADVAIACMFWRWGYCGMGLPKHLSTRSKDGRWSPRRRDGSEWHRSFGRGFRTNGNRLLKGRVSGCRRTLYRWWQARVNGPNL